MHVTDQFPSDLAPDQVETVRNAALDVCTAICNYLATALKYLPRSDLSNTPSHFPADILGNYLSAFVHPDPFAGPERAVSAATKKYTESVISLGVVVQKELWLGMRRVSVQVHNLPSVIEGQFTSILQREK